MDALIDVRFESDTAIEVWKGKERYTRKERYFPYFYVIAKDPDEMRWLLCAHPRVIDCSLESRYPDITSKEMAPLVRIKTALADFKSVASDIRRIPGILSLAETTIPHHFRYCMEKGLSFFDCEPELSMGVIGSDGRMIDGKDASAARSDAIINDPKRMPRPLDSDPFPDIVFSWGPISRRLPCIHIDLKESMRYDIYGDDLPGEDLLSIGKERIIRVMELSHLTSVRPEAVCRMTPGKLNTFLHMRASREHGYIVPDTKKQVERPKSLDMMRRMDKGGTIFFPPPGIYHDVGKCDFASMYPNIIVKYNITPEKMHCTCGDDITMPISGWSICRKRGIIPHGIEKVLMRRLALKRMMRAEQDPDKKHVLDIRQKALKNILVTCFGYLGFSNFVFSNVECKEAVMCYGRHILERTKEIAEDEGLEVLYGVVDSVFVRIAKGSEPGTKTEKTTPDTSTLDLSPQPLNPDPLETKNDDSPTSSRARFERFVKRVSLEFGIELELDCVFRAIAFPCAEDGSGIANKYYGMTYDGKIEARGISYRHSDAPAFIKDFEREAIPKILGRDMVGLGRVFETYRAGLIGGVESGRGTGCGMKSNGTGRGDPFSLDDLAITKSIRDHEYKVNAPHVVAYRQQPTNAGYVTFVYTKQGPMPLDLAKKLGANIDPLKYEDILMRAKEEMMRGVW